MRSLTVVALLISTLAAAPALAAPASSRSMETGMHSTKLWQGLQLTGAQQQKVKQLRTQSEGKQVEAWKAVKTERKSLMVLFGDANADEARLRAQHDKVIAAATQAMKLHFDHMLAVRAILTPEQRMKFSTQRMKHRGMMDCPMCEAGEDHEE